MLLASLTDTALALVLTITDGGAGVTGAAPTVRLREGDSLNSYLDFFDNTFKTSGWTTQDRVLDEVGDGHYQDTLDVSAITSLADGDSVIAEFRNASPDLDVSEVIILENVVRVGMTLTVNSSGGVTGLTATAKIRDATTLDKYLDFFDDTFKTSGWTQQTAAMTEIARGHYHLGVDTSVWLSFSGLFVGEYETTGSLAVDASDPVLGVPSVAPPALPDTTPPVVSNYSPAPDGILAPTDTISFDVTDETGLFHSLVITVFYPLTYEWEVIHTGTDFAPKFKPGSSRTAITDGFHYSVRRVGGWASSPLQIFPFVVDAGGNPNAT